MSKEIDNTQPFISIIQINAVIDLLTDSPSEFSIDMYNRDPIVNRLVCAIKNVIINKGN